MGVILLFLSLSETLLSSGVRILKNENIKTCQITVGLEINPNTLISEKGRGLFIKRGYNYLYLKDADSLVVLSRFVDLLSKDSLFYLKEVRSHANLLRLVLKEYSGNASPVVNITVGISRIVDENFITVLFNSIPGSIISNSYYTLKPIQGKHIYPGDEDFIANISPSPFEDDFLPFLVCLQVIQDRGFRVKFSPETAPSPFLIYPGRESVFPLIISPETEEIKRAVHKVYRWMKGLLQEENGTKLLVITAGIGIDMDKFNGWLKELQNIEIEQIQRVLVRYLLDGFVSSASPELSSELTSLFPEAEVIR